MRNLFLYFLSILIIGFFACSHKKKEPTDENSQTVEEQFEELGPEYTAYHVMMTGYDTTEFNKHYQNRIEPPLIDLNQSLENKSLADLVILQNTILAMKGNLFDDAILHSYFKHLPWYQPPYWDHNFSIALNAAETTFTKRIEAKIAQLRQKNYVGSSLKLPNTQNIINTFQWENITPESSAKLAANGFIIEVGRYNQLFDIYEQNQQDQLPSFITTDLILQQLHLFYGELENEIEEIYLSKILSSMLEIINQELYVLYEKTLDPKIEKSIEENLLFYSIPYAVITNKKNNLIGNYNEIYFDELGKVLAGKGIGSKIMENDQLDYVIFQPSQHYTKNERIQHYFKALTWLQKINLCLNDEKDFSNAVLVADIINRNTELKNQYKKFIEYKTYFSSQKEQFTLWDLADILNETKNKMTLEDLFDEKIIGQIKTKLKLNAAEKCQLEVSLMPIEYQNRYTDLAEIDKSSKNPSSNDLFAALGNPAARQIYASAKYSANSNHLESISENLVSISSQENAISMDWLSTLLTSYNNSSTAQEYMSQSPWKKKELNAAFASWIQLDQRVHLSAEDVKTKKDDQKKFPPTVLRGYVEPNLAFWKAASTLLNNTEIFLTDRNILSDKTTKNLEHLLDIMAFLDEVSQKEIKGVALDTRTYDRIATMGIECHDFALGLINPNFNTRNQRINTNMAFATQVFRGEGKNNLVGGTGFGNTILAMVEIDGFLYLTRGAVFSYYEIKDYPMSKLNDGGWKELIKSNNPPDQLSWMVDLMEIPGKKEELAAAK